MSLLYLIREILPKITVNKPKKYLIMDNRYKNSIRLVKSLWTREQIHFANQTAKRETPGLDTVITEGVIMWHIAGNIPFKM